MAADLASMAPWLKRVAPLLYRRCSLSPERQELAAWLEENPRLLVVLNHGPALGPLPALTALGQALLDAGGGERVPFGIPWRGFYRLPLLNRLAGSLTQVSGELGVDEAVARLRQGPWTDCCLMPEGDLANLGNGLDVQPFRSSRFVELAVRAGVPILLVAHQGTETLGRSVEVPYQLLGLRRWLPEHLRQPLARHRQLSVPWLLNGRVKHLRIICELHWPGLKEADLDSQSGPMLMSREAQQVRSRLQRLVNKLALQAEGDS